jgi:hypothetical protein
MLEIPPPVSKPVLVCQAPTSRGEPIRWLVILADGTSASLTTKEALALARPT